MPVTFDIVVSAENNHYMSWQCMLFHYSCLRHLGRIPIIVVHSDSNELAAGFRMLSEKGGHIQIAQNFKLRGKIGYPPRNTVGTLQVVRSKADYLVLCDSDMIFLRNISLEKYTLDHHQISFDNVNYLQPVGFMRGIVKQMCRHASVDPDITEHTPISGGVPHIIPSALRQSLCNTWFEQLDYFLAITEELRKSAPAHAWLASMWGLVVAAYKLQLEPVMTEFCINNLDGNQTIREDDPNRPSMVHYCYGDHIFNKKKYISQQQALNSIWQIKGTDHKTVTGVICAEISKAAAYYGLNA